MENVSKFVEINETNSAIFLMSQIYVSMHLFHIKENLVEVIKSNAYLDKFLAGRTENIVDLLKETLYNLSEEPFAQRMVEFADLETISERMGDENTIAMEFVGRNFGWCRARFIVAEREGDEVTAVLFAVENIESEKKKEEEIISESVVDVLTGCYNRKGYENDLRVYPQVPPEENFVYASLDLDGLKAVNDNLGHVAGDELLKAAAACIKRSLGSYGRIYRTGGDEFAAILFVNPKQLESVKEDLKRQAYEWKGTMDSTLSISIGFASKVEFPKLTVREMADIADRRMYEDKTLYYKKNGVDRKSILSAFHAICSSYEKILKVNLTRDEFQMIQSHENELNKEKGYSEKISEWLYAFAETGQVHESDRKDFMEKTNINYLKFFFSTGNVHYRIRYKRKLGDTYHNVIMEMMPAMDYTEDNQTVYLYVKDIG